MSKLYAFDKPNRKAKELATKLDAAIEAATLSDQPAEKTGILTSRTTEESSIPSRPI